MTTETIWSQPNPVTDLDLAFGVDVVRNLMPTMAEIPEEFTRNSRNKWRELQADWFFYGLKDTTWTAKPGIDKKAALRHLKAIQASWEPKHEHKEAAVAYLASLWFDDVTYKRAKETL